VDVNLDGPLSLRELVKGVVDVFHAPMDPWEREAFVEANGFAPDVPDGAPGPRYEMVGDHVWFETLERTGPGQYEMGFGS
jgi:hypothetical protein